MNEASQNSTPADGALSFIRSTPLSPIQHKLLKCFVELAVDPNVAASYLMGRVGNGTDGRNDHLAALSSFLSDWKQLCRRLTIDSETTTAAKTRLFRRENSKCFVTVKETPRWDFFGRHKLEAVHIVAPSFLDVEGKYTSQSEMLEAFLTSDGVKTLRSHLSPISEPALDSATFQDERAPIVGKAERLDNLLLLSSDVKAAFKSGRICLCPYRQWDWNKFPTSDPELQNKFHLQWSFPGPFPDWIRYGGRKPRSAMFSTIIIDADHQGPLSPSPFLFSIQARFAQPLRWFDIEDQVASGLPSETSWSWNSLNPAVFSFLRTSWLALPKSLRLKVYNLLLYLGSKMYQQETDWTQRVPFGLYIKHGTGTCVADGEGTSMRLVEKHTDVLTSKLIDELQDDDHSYLIMTRVPGRTLKGVHHLMSYDQRSQLLEDLSLAISQFRQIPNTNSHLICNSVGGPVYDCARLPNDSVGPFDHEVDFNAALADHAPDMDAVSVAHSRTHQVYFTHGDLSPNNILVNNGKLSGILDFGFSGYYPEYWEYAKFHRSLWGPIQEWEEDVTRVFGADYQAELKAEIAMCRYRQGF